MSKNLVVSVVVAAVVLRLLSWLAQSIYEMYKARQLGCGSAPLYKRGDPWGIGNLRESVQANKEKKVLKLLEARRQRVSAQQGREVTTFRSRQMFRESVSTVDPKNIQAVLATQFKDFELGTPRRTSLNPLLGSGIFTTDGQEWSHSRSLMRPQFTRDQISQLDLEERHVLKAMRALPVGKNGWTAVTDLQPIFFRLTIDSATEFLFGDCIESQEAAMKSGQDYEFSYHFDKAQWYCAQRGRFEKLHWIVDTKESHESNKYVHDFVDRYVQAALEVAKNEKNNGSNSSVADEEKGSEGPYVFLHALARTTQDPIELRSQLLNILLAGRDTTASLLSWTMMLLARHPAVFDSLRQTIVETFGTFANPNPISFAGLKACQPLQHTLNETLRLYPVVPVNRRIAVRDTTIPRGGGPDGSLPVFIPKGFSVSYNTHILHRRKDIWGEDAEEFRPERWQGRKPGWDYIPFNGGPRICIGQQFALTEAGYVLVRLLQRFDSIENLMPDTEVRHNLTLTSGPGDPVLVRLHESA